MDSNQAIKGIHSQFKFRINYAESLKDAPVQVMLLKNNQIMLTILTAVDEQNEVEVSINEPIEEGTYVVRMMVDNRFLLPSDESEQIEIVPNTVTNRLDQLTDEQRQEVQEMAEWLRDNFDFSQINGSNQIIHRHPVEALINQYNGQKMNYWAGPESELPIERDPNTIYDVWSDDDES